jgi:hypothetical protein
MLTHGQVDSRSSTIHYQAVLLSVDQSATRFSLKLGLLDLRGAMGMPEYKTQEAKLRTTGISTPASGSDPNLDLIMNQNCRKRSD